MCKVCVRACVLHVCGRADRRECPLVLIYSHTSPEDLRGSPYVSILRKLSEHNPKEMVDFLQQVPEIVMYVTAFAAALAAGVSAFIRTWKKKTDDSESE